MLARAEVLFLGGEEELAGVVTWDTVGDGCGCAVDTAGDGCGRAVDIAGAVGSEGPSAVGVGVVGPGAVGVGVLGLGVVGLAAWQL